MGERDGEDRIKLEHVYKSPDWEGTMLPKWQARTYTATAPQEHEE